jgi:hypothetical protein
MKTTFFAMAVQNCARLLPTGIVFAIGVTFLDQDAMAQPVNYGTASSFSLLGGSEITFASPTNTISGNIGSYPTPSVTGLANVSGPYTNQSGDTGLMLDATNDFGAAMILASGEPVTTTFTAGDNQLGGQTLVPGVYQFPAATTANLEGTLTLDGNGVYIFIGTSSLVTASDSDVVLEDGATPCDVLWVVPTGSGTVTLGSDSTFVGTIMAGVSIGLGTDVDLDGRAWANAAVTLDGGDTVTGLPCKSLGGTRIAGVPDAGSTLLLLGFGLASMFAFGRRSFSRA